MKSKRRKFTTEFKTKVVLEALKEQETLEFLSKKYELQPNQIINWKKQALSNFSNLFASENKEETEKVDVQNLYAQIGELKVENDFLKKKLK